MQRINARPPKRNKMAARMCQYEKRRKPQREHQKCWYTLPPAPWGWSVLVYINPTRTVGLEEKWVCQTWKALWGFPGGSDLKNPPAMQETWVRSLGWEDSLKKRMATHSSILAWRIPQREDILLWHWLFISSNKLSWSETVIKQPPNFIWLPWRVFFGCVRS